MAVLKVMHLIGLVIGLGGVVVLDVYLLSLMVRRRRVQEAEVGLVHDIANLAAIGLVVLWISGIGFLAHYFENTPHLLGNPNVHVKILAVTVLTLNGWILHRHVLPIFGRQLGRRLLDGTDWQGRALMLGCGAVSAASWYFSFTLGAVRALNFAAEAWVFAGAYPAVLLGAVAVSVAFARYWAGAAAATADGAALPFALRQR